MHRKNIREAIIRMTHYSKTSHVGACLSVVDLLYALYFGVLHVDPQDPRKADRDRFILSKGHASVALYATLAERGFFPREWLDRFHLDGGLLPGHLDFTVVPGVEASTGSLGHGLSIGTGIAIAHKQTNNPGKVFVLLGDGESSLLILVQVFSMRWNVVIGGQLFSKSLRGFTDYHLPLLGKEGLLVALILFSLPFITFYICTLILPIFPDETEMKAGN